MLLTPQPWRKRGPNSYTGFRGQTGVPLHKQSPRECAKETLSSPSVGRWVALRSLDTVENKSHWGWRCNESRPGRSSLSFCLGWMRSRGERESGTARPVNGLAGCGSEATFPNRRASKLACALLPPLAALRVRTKHGTSLSLSVSSVNQGQAHPPPMIEGIREVRRQVASSGERFPRHRCPSLPCT